MMVINSSTNGPMMPYFINSLRLKFSAFKSFNMIFKNCFIVVYRLIVITLKSGLW